MTGRAAKIAAIDLFCGAGGLSHGMRDAYEARLYFDCRSRTVVLFGRIKPPMRAVDSAEAVDARRAVAARPRSRADFEGTAFALALRPDRLPASVALLSAGGRHVGELQVPAVCADDSSTGLIPVL